MTINFGGFKNSGAKYYTNILGENNFIKFWTQLTNDSKGAHLDKYANLLEKYPSADEFVRIKIHDETVPIEESAISINGKLIIFDEMTSETQKDAEQARALIKDLKASTDKPEIDEAYFKSEKPVKNLGFDPNHLSYRDKLHLIFESHSSQEISKLSDVFDSTLTSKYIDTFSKN